MPQKIKKYHILLEKNSKTGYNRKCLKGVSVRNYLTREEREELNMAAHERNRWILLLFILSGLVIGGLLGELASRIDWLWWLAFGDEFGLKEPLILNLQVMTITFGMMIKINIASIIGVVIALFTYRKIY